MRHEAKSLAAWLPSFYIFLLCSPDFDQGDKEWRERESARTVIVVDNNIEHIINRYKQNMKLWAIAFTLLPLLGIIYAGYHIWRILPFSTTWRTVTLAVLLLCVCCFFMQFLCDIDSWSMPLARLVYEVGNSSIFILLYLVMLFIVLDVLHLCHVVPSSLLTHSVRGTVGVTVIMVGIFTGAYLQYMHKVARHIKVETLKPLPHDTRVILVSDLHLGYHNTRADLHKWVDMINAHHPDLILTCGDIIDRSIRPLQEEHMAEEFHRLKAPVYGVFGNHEYFCGQKDALQFYADAGIHIMNDRAVSLDSIDIIGRDDYSRVGRQKLELIMQPLGFQHFSILLDHQPATLEDAHKQNVDFQFSGHTHNGQMWPINWIEKLIYDDAYGPTKRGQTNYYVTSGLGQWGAKFRIGSRSEYVVLDIVQRK